VTLAVKKLLRMTSGFSNAGPTISFKDGVYDNIIPQPVLAHLKVEVSLRPCYCSK